MEGNRKLFWQRWNHWLSQASEQDLEALERYLRHAANRNGNASVAEDNLVHLWIRC